MLTRSRSIARRGAPQAAKILKRLSSTATTGTETLSTMGSLRNALTAASTDFSASGLVSLGSGQVPGFDQVAFYQHLVVSSPLPSRALSGARWSAVPPQCVQVRVGSSSIASCQHLGVRHPPKLLPVRQSSAKCW